MNLENSQSQLHSMIFSLHSLLLIIIVAIFLVVASVLFSIWNSYLTSRTFSDHQSLELFWTCLPMLILLSVSLPSIKLLYVSDEWQKPNKTIKTIGHQWYWEYETYNVNYSSYMALDLPRNLACDSSVSLLIGSHNILTTSADVIHSWALPAIGCKVDAVPGRINCLSIYPLKPGILWGQCSEICGANHSFMPICAEVHAS